MRAWEGGSLSADFGRLEGVNFPGRVMLMRRVVTFFRSPRLERGEYCYANWKWPTCPAIQPCQVDLGDATAEGEVSLNEHGEGAVAKVGAGAELGAEVTAHEDAERLAGRPIVLDERDAGSRRR